MEKKILNIALLFAAAAFIYLNRDFFNPIKVPLNADSGSKGDTPNVADTQNATGTNEQAISRAMNKLRTGMVEVKTSPAAQTQ
jgi:hypothetical protein